MWQRGRLVAKVREGKAEAGAKYADYFDFAEAFTTLPSHRVLAVFRGEKEEILELTLEPEEPVESGPSSYEQLVAEHFRIADQGRPADRWLLDTVRWAWRTRILIRLSVDLRMRLWQAAEDEAVRVFAANLRDLLLAAPAGTRPTMGLDPGYRTGVKVAVVDAVGKVAATATIYPHQPHRRWDEAIEVLARLAREHKVELVAIGNGTASRETDQLAAALIQAHPELKLTKVMVSEAGASVYSASAYASQRAARPGRVAAGRGVDRAAAAGPAGRAGEDRPEVDRRRPVPARRLRGQAVARRSTRWWRTASTRSAWTSTPPRRRCSPESPGSARGWPTSIVAYRDAHGPFRSRAELTKVPRLGPKAFEQCAGFLRIRGGDDPLDASAVHPEAYPVVHRILKATGQRGGRADRQHEGAAQPAAG